MATDQAPRERTIRQPRPRVPTPPGLWARCAEWSLFAVIATWLLAVVPLRPLMVAALAGFSTVAVCVIVARRHRVLSVWAVAWALLADGWLLIARIWSPWQPALLIALAGLLIVMTPIGVRAIAHDIHEQARYASREADRDAAKYLARWTTAFDKLNVPGIRAIEETEHATGRSVLLELPDNGRITVERLGGLSRELERALRTPVNSIRFEKVEHNAALCRLHVVEKTFLGTDIPLPELPARLTVTKPLPLARQEDGKTAEVLFRELAVMVLGATGSGKTNLLTVLTALFGRCVDTIVLMIDIEKQGRLAAPWMMPWIQGNAPRPAVDWVATTRDEAEIMLKALLRVLEARAASLAGGSKIIPSASQPQFILICDEMAGILGQDFSRKEGLSNAGFFELGKNVTRLGRSEAILPVWATQRATGSFTGGNDLKSQCKLRFGLGTATEQEAMSAVPDDYYAARLMALLSKPGSALINRAGQRMPLPVMLYRLDPSDDHPEDRKRIYQIATENAVIRPAPDALALDAMGRDWEDRWERSDLYRRLMLREHPPEDQPAPERKTAVPLPADIHDEFNAITGAEELADLKTISVGGKPRSPWKERVHVLLGERPKLGWSVSELRHELKKDGLTVARETVSRHLSSMVDLGVAERHNDRYRLRQDRPL